MIFSHVPARLRCYGYGGVIKCTAIASKKNPPSPPVTGGAKETYSHYPSTLTGKAGSEFPQSLEEAKQIRDLLMQTSDELTNLLRGLNGEYIPPAPGGDLLRDGPGVLPTRRNIHALDPYRMPSPAAYERGRAIALAIIAQHRKEHGQYWWFEKSSRTTTWQKS